METTEHLQLADLPEAVQAQLRAGVREVYWTQGDESCCEGASPLCPPCQAEIVPPVRFSALDRKCDTCDGTQLVCRKPDQEHFDTCGDNHTCPDCVAGRLLVDIRATCPMCHGAKWLSVVDQDEDTGEVGSYEVQCTVCSDGTIVVARAAVRVWPVVAHGRAIEQAWMPHVGPDQHGNWFIWRGPNIDKGENPTTGRYDWKIEPITLDPLPVPGEWVIHLEVAA